MVRRIFFLSALTVPLVILALATITPHALWTFALVGPVLLVGFYDVLQRKHALPRVYPVIGHGRYLMESIRPEIQQYFVESNIDGSPYSREFRSVIYQRAKRELDTMPFGTQRDVQRVGYEWVSHSLDPVPTPEEHWRIRVGGDGCGKPYLASYLNISAMSYGSLSKNAILALNTGASLGGFAHNTGEGGISPYHQRPGGDLIWQVGTGYFGCRSLEGGFDAEKFKVNAALDAVKMIEVKLSQGAKPGHGGILPAAKVSEEIATIRGVPMGQDVLSPASHTAFDSPTGLLEFVARLRELSGGKPVGFKLCIGEPRELFAVCKAMLETGIQPDFITVDGAEGGTGAAPVELSNSVGMPLRHGLLMVHNALTGAGLRQGIRVIAAGKISTGFHMLRLMALGADMCNAARAMMFALGCIQARRCNDNTCPVGVATQDPARMVGLDVADKARRVERYHHQTIHSFMEITSAMGLDGPDKIHPSQFWRQADPVRVLRFDQVYDYLEPGCLLDQATVPEPYKKDWSEARSDRF